MELKDQYCLACNREDIQALPKDQRQTLCSQLNDWKILSLATDRSWDDGQRLDKSWKFTNFAKAIEFINSVAKLAEKEGHHPDIHLINYRDVVISLHTHSVNDLTINDFILAAKIDEI